MDKSMQPAARHGPKLCEAQAAIPIHVEFREHLRDLAQAVAPPTSLFRAVTKQCHAEVPRAYRTSLLEVKNLENLRNPLLVAVDIRRDQRREQQGVVDIAIFLTVEGGHKVPQLGQAHDVPQTTTAAEARRSPWRGAAEVRCQRRWAADAALRGRGGGPGCWRRSLLRNAREALHQQSDAAA
eukprot:CAMPEP_0177503134 /NCGR_PEP_ID=MMETSP0369-20130122/38147_1 /TAXON_ID=447022 ORGANISM="Scrippsiella hangoei-like, Strain SHHI-4" /NCGR_SAMPLE_ID=MMETSP0369 /ASSEMBLY_ACC=CAM_ASM_000364 /LENGTH=181 /DNA_ID=CAMNT_0018980789 /DNA_START=250 /DNA_END=795 /DNA_ORIENTATION=-